MIAYAKETGTHAEPTKPDSSYVFIATSSFIMECEQAIKEIEFIACFVSASFRLIFKILPPKRITITFKRFWRRIIRCNRKGIGLRIKE